MKSTVITAHTELLDDASQFYAPVSSDLIDSLIGQYNSLRAAIVEMSAKVLEGTNSSVVNYFITGNRDSHQRFAPAVSTLFDAKGAIASLNSDFWKKTLDLTDVLSCMPQKRRDEWDQSIIEMKAPDYTEEAVRPTITELLNSRHKFMAERVDGIFRGLSGEHVTNNPSGFGKRMIISNVTGNGFYNESKLGLINDLRCVIAKFMGRDEPKWYATKKLGAIGLKRHGEWITIDGGALRMRCYLKGTAHLEVHPDMAWRLNQVLHSMYPMAIPAKFRTKPPKKDKQYTQILRPIPFQAVEILAELRRERNTNVFSLAHHHNDLSSVALADALRVLESIGGVITKKFSYRIEFDYDPRNAIDDIIASGCIPDQKSHQYYPTPDNVASDAFDLLDVDDSHDCLEPSAGQGALAKLLHESNTVCVEISELHCKILEAKGHIVVKADFLAWSKTTNSRFDRVLMNPPFSDGRAQAHLEAAASLVKQSGVLVAILPASMRGNAGLEGWKCEWSHTYTNEFAGTGVSVVILKATKL